MTEKTTVAYITTLNETVRFWIQNSQTHLVISFFRDSIEFALQQTVQNFDQVWIDEKHPDTKSYTELIIHGVSKIQIISKQQQRSLARNAH